MPSKANKWFISHSYADADLVESLLATLPRQAVPVIFPPIKVNPEDFVSNRLIASILDSDALVYIDGGRSQESFWVAFERDYASRSGKLVYRFDPASKLLERDSRGPLDLATFASYHHADDARIRKALTYLKHERHFDMWVDKEDLEGGVNWQNAIDGALRDTVARGGYAVVFWSTNSARSEFVVREIARVGDERHVILALIDDAPVPDELARYQRVPLYGDAHRAENQRLDDLVVRVYWLIHRNTRSGHGSAGSF
jgi:hypothetical protein